MYIQSGVFQHASRVSCLDRVLWVKVGEPQPRAVVGSVSPLPAIPYPNNSACSQARSFFLAWLKGVDDYYCQYWIPSQNTSQPRWLCCFPGKNTTLSKCFLSPRNINVSTNYREKFCGGFQLSWASNNSSINSLQNPYHLIGLNLSDLPTPLNYSG